MQRQRRKLLNYNSASEDTLASLSRNEIKLVLGDFNTVVGKTNNNYGYCDIVGNHCLRTRNERRERLPTPVLCRVITLCWKTPCSNDIIDDGAHKDLVIVILVIKLTAY